MDFGGLSAGAIYFCDDRCFRINRKPFCKMNSQPVFLFCIGDGKGLCAGLQDPCIPCLAAALCVERGRLQDELPGLFAFCFYLPVFDDPRLRLQQFISYKFRQRIPDQGYPVFGIERGRCAGTGLLLL